MTPSTPKPRESTATSSGYQFPKPSEDPSLSPFEKVELFLDNFRELDAFDVFVKSNLRLVSVVLHPKGSPGPLCTCVFALTVTSPLCNRFGTLHGGATAYLIDICTTLALAPIAAPGFWGSAGVSRTLSATYLRPAPQGMEVRVVAEVVQAGRRTCSLRARVEDGQTGVWLSTGEHCKVENSDIKSVEGGSEKEERERDSMLIGRAKL